MGAEKLLEGRCWTALVVKGDNGGGSIKDNGGVTEANLLDMAQKKAMVNYFCVFYISKILKMT